MKVFLLGIFMCSISILSFLDAASKKGKFWIDPLKATAEDLDFSIQGEYGGSKYGKGAQVVALGHGQFDVYVLDGGLPGDGWDRSKAKTKLNGKRIDLVLSIESGKKSIRIESGVLNLKEDKKSYQLVRIERQSPTLGLSAPKGAKVLFDGKTVSQWEKGKLSPEGFLIQGTKSKETFGSHRLHLEFRTPYKPFARGQGRGNSGLYVQSRYETQILDSFGLEGKMNECGGVYSVKASDVNMCLPPLQWQTYDIDFKAAEFKNGKKVKNARMTVRLNGVIIHKDLEIPKRTTASPLAEGPQNGPIYLQNHGNPVRFRNIWVASSPIPTSTKTVSQTKAFDKVDVTINLAVKHSSLKYDKDMFKVPTNAKVKLVFDNTDEMAHNVVFCDIGTDTKKIGEAAMALGEKGMSMHYIPKSDKILFYTKMIEPGKKGTLYFKTPKKAGDYPYVCTFPGHFLIMKGIMRVGTPTPDVGLSSLTYKSYKGSFGSNLPDFSKLKHHKSGELTNNLVSLSMKPSSSDYGIVYEGKLHTKRRGQYHFFLSSDDGSKLYVNDQTVVNNDGTHGMIMKTGSVYLRPGTHNFKLEFFQGKGGEGLSLAWKGPGMSKQINLSESKSAAADTMYMITVEDKPRIYRTGLNLPGMDKGAYSVAVGLPGKINYCFDAKSCFLRAAWKNDFLNTKADWAGRGGKGANIGGDLFYKNNKTYPLQFEGIKNHDIKYIGYRLKKGHPTFMYEVGGSVKVQQSFKSNSNNSGLIQTFEITGAKGNISYNQAGHKNIKSDSGSFENGKLIVKANPNQTVFNVEVAQ